MPESYRSYQLLLTNEELGWLILRAGREGVNTRDTRAVSVWIAEQCGIKRRDRE